MRKAEGVGLLILPGAPVLERQTFTCNHCNRVRTLEKRTGESNVYWCDVCDARVCGPCIDEARDHRCVVWEHKMELMEARARFICDVFR